MFKFHELFYLPILQKCKPSYSVVHNWKGWQIVRSTLVPIAIKDESVKREIPFLVACIQFTVFGTQFAQISTNVLPIRVWLMKIVLMDWTCILVPALLVLLGLRAQVSYQVKADYIQTPIASSNCSFSSWH